MAQPKIKPSALEIGSGPNSVVATDGSGNVTLTGNITTSGTFTGSGTGLSGVVNLTAVQTVGGVKTFTSRSVHSGAYTPSQQTTYSSTPIFDCAVSNVFEPGPLTGNVTSITMSNPVPGQTMQIRFVQDGVGGRTVTVPASSKIDGTPATGANRVNWLVMTYSGRAARWEGNWLVVPA